MDSKVPRGATVGPVGGGGVEPGSKKVGWVLERLGSI